VRASKTSASHIEQQPVFLRVWKVATWMFLYPILYEAARAIFPEFSELGVQGITIVDECLDSWRTLLTVDRFLDDPEFDT
jgi:hypothetical protein